MLQTMEPTIEMAPSFIQRPEAYQNPTGCRRPINQAFRVIGEPPKETRSQLTAAAMLLPFVKPSVLALLLQPTDETKAFELWQSIWPAIRVEYNRALALNEELFAVSYVNHGPCHVVLVGNSVYTRVVLKLTCAELDLLRSFNFFDRLGLREFDELWPEPSAA